MSWFRRLAGHFGLGRARQLDQLALVIAQRCQPTVWRRVAAPSLAMTPSELRGYIRARAVGVVQDHVRLSISENRSQARLDRAALVEQALEQVVRLAIRQWLSARTATLEPLRRAA